MAYYPVRTVKLKKLVLEWAEAFNNTSEACREWKVPRSTFYRWKKAYAVQGEAVLIRKGLWPRAIRGSYNLRSSRKSFT